MEHPKSDPATGRDKDPARICKTRRKKDTENTAAFAHFFRGMIEREVPTWM
jgi:hypothetical protein